jgi:hypothetical protein
MHPVPQEHRPPEGHRPDGAAPLTHPLAVLIAEAAAGRFPPVDGGWQRVPPWRPGLEGIVAFTGHAVLALAADVTDEWLAGFGVNGLGGAHDPRLIAALAGPDGWIASLDVLLARRGTGRPGAAGAGPDGLPRLALVRTGLPRLALVRGSQTVQISRRIPGCSSLPGSATSRGSWVTRICAGQRWPWSAEGSAGSPS